MIPKKLQHIFTNPFFRQVGTLFTGTVVAQAVPYFVAPILLRIFSPELFGDFGLYVGISSVIAMIVSWGFEQSVMLFEKDEKAARFVYFIHFLIFGTSIIAALIIYLLSDYLLQFFSTEAAAFYLPLIPVMAFLFGSYRTISTFLNRKEKYKTISVAEVSRASLMSAGQLSFGAANILSKGLVLGELVGQFVRFAITWKKFLRITQIHLRDISWNEAKADAFRFKKFPIFTLPASLLSFMSSQIPIFVLAFFFNPTIVGLYYLPHKLMTVPFNMIGTSISKVYFKQASKLDSQEKLQSLTWSIFSKLFTIGLIPFAIVTFFGDYLFVFILGEEWRISGHYAMMLSPWLFITFASSPISIIYTIKEKQRQSLQFNIALFTCRVIALLLGGWWFGNAYIAVALFAFVGIVFILGLLWYVFHLTSVCKKSAFIFISIRILLVFGFFGLLRLAVLYV